MKTPQFEHQKIGTAALVEHKAFALFDEMGAGKSKQVIDAACQLAEQDKIDTVVVVAPASVRCVWLDVEIGEIGKHSWQPSSVWEYHSKFKRVWETGTTGITWIITNYEFLRSGDHLADLCINLLNRKTLLVLDESSYIKNRTAAQTKAIAKLRKHCDRCVILNGTPITQSPLDLWSQVNILDEKILKSFHNFYNFRAHYCELRSMRFGGRPFQQVVSYKNLDHLAAKLAPYVLRREKKDCLDLPPKLYTEREVALTPESWARYKELKKDFVMTLGKGDVRLEPNAAVRVMRLAQLTSGILGGGTIGSGLPEIEGETMVQQDLSDEKLRWAVQYLTEECTARAVIVWCRWRRERERLVEALTGKIAVYELYGGQPERERSNAVALFSVVKEGSRAALVAQPHAGGFGLNLVAASEAIYLSNDFSLGIRLQSEDRMHRPGQFNPCTYIDVLATGPKGERTIDHIIFKALREKKDLAQMTCDGWRKELEAE